MAAVLEGRDPVFVFGALRSGTTVFRLMLDAHGGISNPGEVDFLFDHLQPDPSHPTGYCYRLTDLRHDRIFQATGLDIPEGQDGLDLLRAFLDQLARRTPGVLTLNVHRHADRIAAVLPEAKIIHILRDPRDVARSSIGMGWAGTLYHGVGHWIRTEENWEKARSGFGPENVLELTYEALIRSPEAELRRVCAFLGLPYAPSMLTYHEGTTYERPDIALIEQWRRKSTPHEIALVEGRAGDLMRRRGYEPTGAGHVPGLAERARLAVSNKLAVWRFGAKRYGFGLYFGEKFTRWAGMKAANTRLRLSIAAETRKYLK